MKLNLISPAERDGFRDAHPDWCRTKLTMAVLDEYRAQMSEKLVASGHAPLMVEEVVAPRLYTGVSGRGSNS